MEKKIKEAIEDLVNKGDINQIVEFILKLQKESFLSGLSEKSDRDFDKGYDYGYGCGYEDGFNNGIRCED